jgi:hypothetical protein
MGVFTVDIELEADEEWEEELEEELESASDLETEEKNIYEKIQNMLYNFNSKPVSKNIEEKRIYTSSDPIPIPCNK